MYTRKPIPTRTRRRDKDLHLGTAQLVVLYIRQIVIFVFQVGRRDAVTWRGDELRLRFWTWSSCALHRRTASWVVRELEPVDMETIPRIVLVFALDGGNELRLAFSSLSASVGRKSTAATPLASELRKLVKWNPLKSLASLTAHRIGALERTGDTTNRRIIRIVIV